MKMKKLLLSLICCLFADLALYGNDRIVSLSPALTELVWHLKQGKTLVGRSSACQYPNTVKQLPIAGNFGQPQVEKVFSLKPTWIIANDFINPQMAHRFRQNGIKVDLRQIRNPEDYRWWVRKIGEMLSCQKEAEKELKRIGFLEQKLKQKKAMPLKILWVVSDRPLMVAGPGSLPDQVISMMKMNNAAKSVPNEYFKCSWEWLLQHQPDWIVWSIPGKPEKTHRLWGKMKAVKNNHVISGIVNDPVQCPGPRWLDSILRLRAKLEQGAIR